MVSNVYFLILLLTPLIFASPIDDENFQIPGRISSIRTMSANTDLDAAEHQASGGVPRCGEFCDFRLCAPVYGKPSLLPKGFFTVLNGPDTASLPYICKKRDEIGEIKRSLEARVYYRENYIPMSSFNPPGLNTRFSTDFMRTKTIPFLPWSGIAHTPTKGNQWSFLHDLCMILPINQYQEIDPKSQLPQRVISTDESERNCVAFRTTAPAILVELIWDSGDDFNIAVTEPDGDTISLKNTRSEAGKLNGRYGDWICGDTLTFDMENILYFPDGPIESGTYTVKATHYNKCETGQTKWRLRVAVNGVNVVTERGGVSHSKVQVVLTTTFTYP